MLNDDEDEDEDQEIDTQEDNDELDKELEDELKDLESTNLETSIKEFSNLETLKNDNIQQNTYQEIRSNEQLISSLSSEITPLEFVGPVKTIKKVIRKKIVK